MRRVKFGLATATAGVASLLSTSSEAVSPDVTSSDVVPQKASRRLWGKSSGSGGAGNHEPTNPEPDDNPSKSRRRRIILIVLVIALILELFLLTYKAMGLGTRKTVATAEVNTDSIALIRGQLSNNKGAVIADIGYDSALDITAVGSSIASVDAKTLTPLSNNYLAKIESDDKGDGKTSQIVLIDETAVGRVIAMNANWVAYLNSNGNEVFGDVLKGSKAEQFVGAYKGYQIVFHRLAIGKIYSNGTDIYVLAQPYYTILKDGKSASVNDVFLYKLTKQEKTLVISDIEQIKLPTDNKGKKLEGSP